MSESMRPREDHDPADDPRTISRRRLLQALVASGLAAAGSSLPANWFGPEVEVGVLPAHAQVSPGPLTIAECSIRRADEEGFALGGSCLIEPATGEIWMRWRITLESPNHTQDGQEIYSFEGQTNAAGWFNPDPVWVDDILRENVPYYNFQSTFEFVYLADGADTCSAAYLVEPT